MNRVVITKCMIGICHMQVCAVKDATDEEILAVANRENPSGTRNGWGTVIRKGKGKPVTCADDKSRKHFLISC
jgi:hypothetical protein